MSRLKINLLACVIVASAMVFLGGCQNVGDWLASRQYAPLANSNDIVEPADTNEVTTPAVKEEAKNEMKYNNIFFLSKKYDPETKNCEQVYWVHILGDATKEPIQRNLNLLLAGPTDKWQQAGYFTVIPADVKLNSVVIKDNIAYVDFSAELNKLAGSCAVLAARSQITATTKAAADEYLGLKLEQVVISVNGDSATALQP